MRIIVPTKGRSDESRPAATSSAATFSPRCSRCAELHAAVASQFSQYVYRGPCRLHLQRYRTPSHSARSQDRGSSTIREVASKRIVARRLASYFGQPGSPAIAKATHALCIACGELLRRRGAKQRSQHLARALVERVEHERDLERVARAHEAAASRRRPGELVHVSGAGVRPSAPRLGGARACGTTSRSRRRREFRRDSPPAYLAR